MPRIPHYKHTETSIKSSHAIGASERLIMNLNSAEFDSIEVDIGFDTSVVVFDPEFATRPGHCFGFRGVVSAPIQAVVVFTLECM